MARFRSGNFVFIQSPTTNSSNRPSGDDLNDDPNDDLLGDYTSNATDSSHLIPHIIEPKVLNILLIGASQNGKSALANFLVTGKSNVKNNNRFFQVGSGMAACTQQMLSQTVTWDHEHLPKMARKHEVLESDEMIKHSIKIARYSFRIIDTPGVGEANRTMEEAHMKMLYRELKRMRDTGEELALALFVVKYPPFETTEFEENISFYRKLMPEIMQNNTILVITAVKHEKDWESEQMVCGIAPEENFAKIQRVVTEKLGKDSNTPVTYITVNSLFQSGSRDAKAALRARNRIFEECLTAPKVALNEIRLPKTNKQLADDSRKLEHLKGEKKGLLDGIALIKDHTRIYDALNLVDTIETQINKCEKEVTFFEEDIGKKNVNSLFEFDSRTYTDTWHLFRKARKPIDYVSPTYNIREVTFVPPNYEIFNFGLRVVDGTVYARRLWSRLNCTMRVYTTTRERYASEIIELNANIEKHKKTIEEKKSELEKVLNQDNQYQAELQSYLKRLREIEAQIEVCETNYIKLE